MTNKEFEDQKFEALTRKHQEILRLQAEFTREIGRALDAIMTEFFRDLEIGNPDHERAIKSRETELRQRASDLFGDYVPSFYRPELTPNSPNWENSDIARLTRQSALEAYSNAKAGHYENIID